jgi:hypothetical protein
MKLTPASLTAGRSHGCSCGSCRWQAAHPSGLMADWCMQHRRRRRLRAQRLLGRVWLSLRHRPSGVYLGRASS